MRHFVGYHNTERMGQTLHDNEPFELLTNNPVDHLRSNTVWFIVGEGAAPKRYSLGSVFVVEDVGKADDDEFQNYARGDGHFFDPPVILNDLDWFPAFLKGMTNFSLGIQELKEPRFIDAILRLASEAGYRVD